MTMRGRINSVEPVLVMRVLDREPVPGGDPGEPQVYDYTYDFEWGEANVQGKSEETLLRASSGSSTTFTDLEGFLEVRINKNLQRDLDFPEYASTPILLYIPSSDTLDDRSIYSTGSNNYYSGWYMVENAVPNLRQVKGGFYTKATARAVYSISFAEAAPVSYQALKRYYETIGDPLVNNPNPNTVDALENSVSNLDYLTNTLNS